MDMKILSRTLPQPDLKARFNDARNPGFSNVWRGAVARSTLTRPLASLFAGLGTCLMYHRICEDEQTRATIQSSFLPNQELIVSTRAFNEQMAFLARNYNCISLHQAIEQLKSGRLPPSSVVVTFDDGYLDNLTLALPVLQSHGIPATVYIATGLIEQTSRLWWYELEQLVAGQSNLHIDWQGREYNISSTNVMEKRLAYVFLNRLMKRMSPEEQSDFMAMLQAEHPHHFNYSSLVLRRRHLAKLADDPLITIGAHTHHHLVLSRLSDIQLRHELLRSRELLQSWLERPVDHLAYPFGSNQQACKREFKVARELGFESAVTTRLGHLQKFHRNHLLALPRVAVGYQDCMSRFEWKLSGLYCLSRRPLSRIRI